jgi:hypothetical protein
MLTRASQRFGSVLAIALVAVVAVALAPVGAAVKTPVTWTAIASWQTGGATDSNVSLQVTMSEGASPILFFFVSQNFCDTKSNEEVFRSFNGSQPANDALFQFGPHLSAAVLGARQVPMSGSEQRIEGCNPDASRVARAHPTSLGSFKASIFGNWMATGPKLEDAPGIKTRDASAFGFQFSHSKLDLGDLGPSQYAQLRRSTVAIP